MIPGDEDSELEAHEVEMEFLKAHPSIQPLSQRYYRIVDMIKGGIDPEEAYELSEIVHFKLT